MATATPDASSSQLCCDNRLNSAEMPCSTEPAPIHQQSRWGAGLLDTVTPSMTLGALAADAVDRLNLPADCRWYVVCMLRFGQPPYWLTDSISRSRDELARFGLLDATTHDISAALLLAAAGLLGPQAEGGAA